MAFENRDKSSPQTPPLLVSFFSSNALEAPPLWHKFLNDTESFALRSSRRTINDGLCRVRKQTTPSRLPPSFLPSIHPSSRFSSFQFFFRDGNVPVPREINSEIPSERRRTWRGLVNFSPLYIFFYYPLILFLSQGDGRILWMRINLNDWQQRGVQLVKYLSFFSFFFFFFLLWNSMPSNG